MTPLQQIAIDLPQTLLTALCGLLLAPVICPSAGRWQRIFLSYLASSALFVVISLFCLVTLHELHVATSYLILLVLSLTAWRYRPGRSISDLNNLFKDSSIVLLIATFVSLIAVYSGRIVLTFDSYDFMFISRAIQVPDNLLDISGKLVSYPIFISIIHASSQNLGGEMNLMFQLMAGFVGFIAALSMLPYKKTKTFFATCFFMTCFIYSNFLPSFSAFYINSHAAFAAYLCVALLCFWKMKNLKDESYWPLFTLCLLAICLLRMEGMIVACVLMLLVMATDEISTRTKLIMFSIVPVICLMWFLTFIGPTGRSTVTSPKQTIVMLVATACPLIYTIIPKLKCLNAYLQPLVLSLLLIGSLSGFIIAGDRVGESVVNVIANVTLYGFWSSGWYAVLTALVLSSQIKKFPGQKDLAFFIISYFLLLILFAFARDFQAFRISLGDSANRMLLHIFPVCLIYILMKIFSTIGLEPHQKNA